jgi:hypothetical protein
MSCSLAFLIDDMDSMFFLSFTFGLEVFDFTALSPSSFPCSCDEFGRKIYTSAGKEYGHFCHITYILCQEWTVIFTLEQDWAMSK